MSSYTSVVGVLNVALATPNTEVAVTTIPEGVKEIMIQAREAVDIQVGVANGLSDTQYWTKKAANPPLVLKGMIGAPKLYIQAAAADTTVEILWKK